MKKKYDKSRPPVYYRVTSAIRSTHCVEQFIEEAGTDAGATLELQRQVAELLKKARHLMNPKAILFPAAPQKRRRGRPRKTDTRARFEAAIREVLEADMAAKPGRSKRIADSAVNHGLDIRDLEKALADIQGQEATVAAKVTSTAK